MMSIPEIVPKHTKEPGGMQIAMPRIWMDFIYSENILHMQMEWIGISLKVIITHWKPQQWW